jgi:ketosteroid isomerase-like protein
MSRENVEVVRSAFAEFERGNFWVPQFFDSAIRVEWLDATPGGEAESAGIDGMTRTVSEWLAAMDRVSLTAERISGAGDRVVVIATWHGRGKASSVPTEWRHGQVWTMRDGKAVRIETYPDPADALEAVGLSE